MGIPDSSLLDLIERVRSCIFLRASDPSSMSGGFPMAADGCKFCYECEMDFTESSLKYHCQSCARWLCVKCVQDYGPSEDVSGDSESSKGSAVNFNSCKFCSNLSTQPKTKRKYSDKIYPAESPRQSPEPPSPNCSGERITGYSPHAVSRSSVASYSGHLSPVSVRHSFSRSDEDDGEDSISYFFSPSSEYFHDSSDVETCSFSARHEFYNFKSVGSSPSDSPSRIHITCDGVGHPVQREQLGTHMYQNDVPFDQGSGAVLRGQEKGNEDPEIADGCGDNLLMFPEHYRKLQKPLDFENSGLIWSPPPPEHEGEETENDFTYDDEDDEIGGTNAAFFSSGNVDPKEPHRTVVQGHFRALVSQLLQGEGIKFGNENGSEDWLNIITAISWQAANFVKPDTSRGGSMDPVDYVKVKCIATGRPSDSAFIRGVVCTKNIKHKRMTSQYKNARILMLGGALEFQGVSNQLESFDILRQKEMDHLKMIVSRIEAHRTNVLLVEKSVSSYAQEYLLAKDISLVLNVKRPLLDRIARCTGALVTPSVEKISTTRLGHCEMFHLEKVLEEHEPANQFNRKPSKTLMFFGGCPRRLGCTVLLKGLSCKELKKLKHVVHYAIFAAYHLSLETSFLADEGASLPKLRAKPIQAEERISTDNLIYSPLDCTFSSNYQEVACISHSILESEGPKLEHGMNQSSSENFTIDYGIHSAAEECGFGDIHFDVQDKCFTPDTGLNNLNSSVSGDIQKHNQEDSPKIGQEESQSIESSEIAPLQRVGEGELSMEYYSAADSHQSLLVSFSSRSVVHESSICERSRLLRIKFYGVSDKPLGRYLQDDLFDQTSCCPSCKEPTEAHVKCYTHQQGNLTINVKRSNNEKLPGEQDGKIWMWHRCLRCPTVDGVPPATPRVVMSDAAWGLSFGKFLELSFSNHATANRVANCGHSLQRDCLRYYGYGSMVAFFRYSPIDILSVCLPPSILEFNASGQDWIRKEATELLRKVEALYAEMSAVLCNIDEKLSSVHGFSDVSELHYHVMELKDLLSDENSYYNDMLKFSDKETSDQNERALDILELNRIRHSLVIGSHVWDRRLYLLNSLLTRSASSRAPQRNETFAKGSSSEHLNEARDLSRFQEWPVETLQPKEESNKLLLNRTESENLIAASSEVKMAADGSLKGAPSDASVLSDTIDSAWTGSQVAVGMSELPNSQKGDKAEDRPIKMPMSPSRVYSFDSAVRLKERISKGLTPPFHLTMRKSFHASGDYRNMIRDPISNVQRTYSQILPSEVQKFDVLKNASPSFVSEGARMMVRQNLNGQNDIVIAVYDNEPTSIITYALSSKEHGEFVSEKPNGGGGSLNTSATAFKTDISASSNLSSWQSLGALDLDYIHYGNYGSEDASSAMVSIFAEQKISPHFRCSFENDSSSLWGKGKFSVTCYFAKQFDALRKKCCPREVDFIRSLSRCKTWSAQGGKSNAYFAKSLDDRFIIKQVSKTELESFEEFAPDYFKYLTDALNSGSPTCLAKILGIYQVVAKNSKGGKEMKIDLMVMENLFFQRKISRIYDLKGSARSRYNADTTGENKVLLDMNLLEALRTQPIFLGSKAKRSLERGVWNDTAFLATVDVMDYSLLVGIDDERKELVLGIIDFMRQYTWDKHLETWVKASGILGGPRNASPTIVSPKLYKKRFRKAMTTYFLTVPEQWSST